MALTVKEVRAALSEGDDGIRHGAIARLDLAEIGAVDLLLAAMGDDSWRVRREAVERACSPAVPISSVLPLLVPALSEGDNVGLRNAAIEAVVNLGARCAPAVELSLAAAPPHRKVLCDVLGRIGAPSSGSVLTRFLRDEDANVQIAAAEALGRVPGPGGLRGESLVERLLEVTSGGERSREFLGVALLEAAAKHQGHLPASLVLRLVDEPVLGIAVLQAIGAGARVAAEPGVDVVTRVVSQLGDGQRLRREAATVALAKILPSDGPTPALSASAMAATTEALLEGTLEVQRAAAMVLGACASVDSARALLIAADDDALTNSIEHALMRLSRRHPTALVVMAGSMTASARAAVYRVMAASLVGGAVQLPAALVAALDVDCTAENGVVACAAMSALGALGGPEAAEVLAGGLETAHANHDELDDGFERSAAANRAIHALAKRHLDAVRTAVRARASLPPFVLLVGHLGGPEDATALLARLCDPTAETRRAGVAGLAILLARPELQLDDAQVARASEAAGEALLDEMPEVRAAAVQTLAAAERRKVIQGAGATLEGLMGATRDEDMRVRGAATRAVIELEQSAPANQKPPLRSALRALADSGDLLVAVPALEALLSLDEVEDDARLVDALTAGDLERRKVALLALVRRPRLVLRGELPRVVERALHDDRWDIRRAAVAALASVGDLGRNVLKGRRGLETDPLVRADLDRALGFAVDETGARRG